MKSVNIAKLKAELSKYLRIVQGGETVRILDRSQAVAEISPIGGKDRYTELVERGLLIAPRKNDGDIRITRVNVSCSKAELLKDFLDQRSDRF